MYESTDKMVSHPPHYQSKNGLEVIDAIEAFTEDLCGIEAADTANIIKYACRWHRKNGIQDLEKILWYTQHLIDHLKEKEEPVSNSGLQYNGTSYEIIFPSYKDAEDVLASLNEIIAEYGCACLSNLYDIADINPPVTLPKNIFYDYGWSSLDDTVRPITALNGFSINLPDLTLVNAYRKEHENE